MAQGESPRNPLAFASVLCPGRCLAVELANSCAYWELPNGNAQRTQDPSRTFTPALMRKQFRRTPHWSSSVPAARGRWFAALPPFPRKVPGLSANPRPRLRSRLRSRRHTCGRTKGGPLL